MAVSTNTWTDLIAGLRDAGVEPDASQLTDLATGLGKLLVDPATFAIDVMVEHGPDRRATSIRLFSAKLETVLIEYTPETEQRTDTVPDTGGSEASASGGGGTESGEDDTGGDGLGLSDDGSQGSGSDSRWERMCLMQPDNPHCDRDEEEGKDDSETPSEDMSVGDPCGFLPRYCESAIAEMVEIFTQGSMDILETRTDTAADELALWAVRDWFRV